MHQVFDSSISDSVARKNQRFERLYVAKIRNGQSQYSNITLQDLFLMHSPSFVFLHCECYYSKDLVLSVSECAENDRSMRKECECCLTLFTCNALAKYCAPVARISQPPSRSVSSVCISEQ